MSKRIFLNELQAIKYLNNKGIFDFKPRMERFGKIQIEKFGRTDIFLKYDAKMTIFENNKNIPIGVTGVSYDNSNNVFDAGTMVFPQFRNKGYGKSIIEYKIHNLSSRCNYYSCIRNPFLYNTMIRLKFKELNVPQMKKLFDVLPFMNEKYYVFKT